MSVTLLSLRHINKHSKAIEHLGIRANSKLDKIYLSCWFCVLVVLIAFFILAVLFFAGLLPTDDSIDLVYMGNVWLAILSFYCVQVLIIGVLNMVVLYAYYKMNHKLTERAKKMITHVLRRSSLAE